MARGLTHAPQLDAASDEVAQHVLGMAFSYAELRHPALFKQFLSAENQHAFARYNERAHVRAVAIEQLEKHPATVGELRRSMQQA